jgi:LuxR family transcriptional regulator, activator of conjugal transfer of Ti plasmids
LEDDPARVHRVFQSFVDALSDGIDADSLKDALQQIADAFGFPLFAYFSVPRAPDASTWSVTNYAAAWVHQYQDRHFYRLDPVILRAAADPEPFLWNDRPAGAKISPAQEQFFSEASAYGIRRGFTLPIVEPGTRMAAVTFASDGLSADFQRAIELHGRTLHLTAIFFHRHAKRILASGTTINGVRLTKREFECLEWAARGKSTWDTGRIMGIRPRTVAFHLDNARAKLGVGSVTQAVALLAAARALIR